MSAPQTRGRWVAMVLIAVAYLVLITVLDSRGPLLPPPPEAMGLGASAAPPAAVAVAPASADAATAPPRG